MSSLILKQLRFSALMSAMALLLAIPLALLLDAFVFPPSRPETTAITAIVTLIVSMPLSMFSAIQITQLSRARKKLADQTESLIAAQKTAEQAANARARFLAVMSHEIRTPLNGILGTAQLLAAGKLNEHERRLVEILQDTGQLLLAQVNDVLDMSRIEAGKISVIPTDIQPRQEIARTVDMFRASAAAKNLEMKLSFGADLPAYAEIDVVRLRQCLSNLLSNAIKFTKAGEVAVSVDAVDKGPGTGLIIYVEDTGIGISAEDQARIFEPFAQVGTVESGAAGTGLGLAICRELARRMGGDLTVSSEMGKGSRFKLEVDLLPSARVQPQNVPVPGDEPNLTIMGRTVLLVDDVATNRMVGRLFLERSGARVIEASDGNVALDLLRAQDIDLVLLDIFMPTMDGWETLGHIRDRFGYALPVVALTAKNTDENLAEFSARGFDGYVAKPIDKRAFEAEITRVLSDRPCRTDADRTGAAPASAEGRQDGSSAPIPSLKRLSSLT